MVGFDTVCEGEIRPHGRVGCRQAARLGHCATVNDALGTIYLHEGLQSAAALKGNSGVRRGDALTRAWRIRGRGCNRCEAGEMGQHFASDSHPELTQAKRAAPKPIMPSSTSPASPARRGYAEVAMAKEEEAMAKEEEAMVEVVRVATKRAHAESAREESAQTPRSGASPRGTIMASTASHATPSSCCARDTFRGWGGC